jgi:hypothetical protein
MDRVGGGKGIEIITMDHFVWGYGNVGRSSAKEGRVGRRIGKNETGGREGIIRDYNWGSFRLRIWECGKVECEGVIRDYIPGRVGLGIRGNGPCGWEGRSK